MGEEVERKRNISCPYEGSGSKDSKWWPPPLCLILEGWGNTHGQVNGSGRLRWLLKQGGVILATQNTETIGVLYNSPLLDMIIVHLSKCPGILKEVSRSR
jgi:hypothetical protein